MNRVVFILNSNRLVDFESSFWTSSFEFKLSFYFLVFWNKIPIRRSQVRVFFVFQKWVLLSMNWVLKLEFWVQVVFQIGTYRIISKITSGYFKILFWNCRLIFEVGLFSRLYGTRIHHYLWKKVTKAVEDLDHLEDSIGSIWRVSNCAHSSNCDEMNSLSSHKSLKSKVGFTKVRPAFL